MWPDCKHFVTNSSHISSCWIVLGLINCLIAVLFKLLEASTCLCHGVLHIGYAKCASHDSFELQSNLEV